MGCFEFVSNAQIAIVEKYGLIYNFSTLTTTSDLNGVHEELVRKFNKHSSSNSVEIENQHLEKYILSKEYWKLPCTSTLINEDQLRECFKIEIIELY